MNVKTKSNSRIYYLRDDYIESRPEKYLPITFQIHKSSYNWSNYNKH